MPCTPASRCGAAPASRENAGRGVSPAGDPSATRRAPGRTPLTTLRILVGGDLWVSECVITYDGVPTYSVSIMEFTDGLVTHETQYFADPFQAPPSRAALAEPVPGRGR